MWIISPCKRVFNTDKIMWFEVDHGTIFACEDSDKESGVHFATFKDSDTANKYLDDLVAKLNEEETSC